MTKTNRSIESYTEAEMDAMDAMEASLQERYPAILAGSILAPDCEDSPFPGKYTVEISCSDCETSRRIATQDLFQVSRCKACTDRNRKANRAAKRASKRAAGKTPEAELAALEAKLAALTARKAELEADAS